MIVENFKIVFDEFLESDRVIHVKGTNVCIMSEQIEYKMYFSTLELDEAVDHSIVAAQKYLKRILNKY